MIEIKQFLKNYLNNNALSCSFLLRLDKNTYVYVFVNVHIYKIYDEKVMTFRERFHMPYSCPFLVV